MIPFNIDASEVLDLVRELRQSGIRVEIELRSRKIGKAMGWADSIGASYALVVGPRDLEQGQSKCQATCGWGATCSRSQCGINPFSAQ